MFEEPDLNPMERSKPMEGKGNEGCKQEWARLYVDESDDSVRATDLLRNAGYCVVTIPVSGNGGPELRLGKGVYLNLAEIRRLVESEMQ